MTALITGNYMVLQDSERVKRQTMFTEDLMHYKMNSELHTKEIGDELAH